MTVVKCVAWRMFLALECVLALSIGTSAGCRGLLAGTIVQCKLLVSGTLHPEPDSGSHIWVCAGGGGLLSGASAQDKNLAFSKVVRKAYRTVFKRVIRPLLNRNFSNQLPLCTSNHCIVLPGQPSPACLPSGASLGIHPGPDCSGLAAGCLARAQRPCRRQVPEQLRYDACWLKQAVQKMGAPGHVPCDSSLVPVLQWAWRT